MHKLTALRSLQRQCSSALCHLLCQGLVWLFCQPALTSPCVHTLTKRKSLQQRCSPAVCHLLCRGLVWLSSHPALTSPCVHKLTKCKSLQQGCSPAVCHLLCRGLVWLSCHPALTGPCAPLCRQPAFPAYYADLAAVPGSCLDLGLRIRASGFRVGGMLSCEALTLKAIMCLQASSVLASLGFHRCAGKQAASWPAFACKAIMCLVAGSRCTSSCSAWLCLMSLLALTATARIPPLKVMPFNTCAQAGWAEHC